jgi:enoyl-CoA hydratase
MAIVADLGSLQRLPAIIGWGNAVEMALTGKDITAIEAQVMGLVTHVTEDAKSALATATQIAHSIAANPPLTVQGVKAVLTATRSMSVQQGLDYVATWNSGNLLSEDLAEAFNAFVQKRPPNFKGA